MRVVLQVTGGPASGRKVWLRSGQLLEVGRSEQADVALPHDEQLAEFHFAIQCDQALCRLRDLGSAAGTFLNGQQVSEAILEDGDRITAGDTAFDVQVEGAAAAAAVPQRAAPQQQAQAAAPAKTPQPAAARPLVQKASGGNRFAFGRWIFEAVPPGWTPLGKHGLRLAQPRRFSHSILIIENPLQQDQSFQDYVNQVAQQIPENLEGATVEGPRSAHLPGAEDAAELVIRHPPHGSLQIVQRQLLARVRDHVGTIMLTTNAPDYASLNETFDQILAGLSAVGEAQ